MAADLDSLDSRRRNLEEAFFAERDRKLIEKKKEQRKLAEAKQNLAKASGISNDAILTKLVELNISADTVASLAIVPLVEVAWADGEVDEKEKNAILKAVNLTFSSKGRIDNALVEQWLMNRPPPELLTAWTEYIQGLSKLFSKSELATLEQDIMEHAVAVAKAAGSFLGMTSGIGKAEQAMLDKLGRAFHS